MITEKQKEDIKLTKKLIWWYRYIKILCVALFIISTILSLSKIQTLYPNKYLNWIDGSELNWLPKEYQIAEDYFILFITSYSIFWSIKIYRRYNRRLKYEEQYLNNKDD